MLNFFLKRFFDAFDRIDIWIDLHPGQEWVDSLPEKVTIDPVNVPYNPRWKYVLRVLQPDASTLRFLQRMLGIRIAAQVAYVEIARDYPVRWKVDAQRLERYFLRTITMRYGPAQVTKHKNTHYFGKPHAPRRLVTYSDRKSKLATAAQGHRCLHTEIRLQETQLIERIGLGTVEALIDFKFSKFWATQVRYHAFGNRAAMGTALSRSACRGTGDGALQARIRRALTSPKYTAGDAFVLQILCRKRPSVTKALLPMTAKAWLREAARVIAAPPREWP
ncbi:hypothetical protein NWF24_19865 [Variovorax paradoxus]|uniref:hypothetical protein n=1 Tax=Variovorax paradoxus TaxID=34073 RepID=UPI0021AC49A0|nr:hypothetical protein [Variovorax paradoxus]UVH55092.1 hypothetical protein NWF24_19865 [Variovorax paradoxus]